MCECARERESVSVRVCASVFLLRVDELLSLHHQLSISVLQLSLSLHLPLHVLPQSLKQRQVDEQLLDFKDEQIIFHSD